MTGPIRIQLRRVKGWRMPPDTVKVDRTTRWGNPFRGGPGSVALTRIEAWITFKLSLRMNGGFWSQRPCDLGSPMITVAEIRRELRGKNLACWCPPSEPCHADVLLELANG